MNAIELLEAQHLEVEELFHVIQASKDAQTKAAILAELSDSLAALAAIDERHFGAPNRVERPGFTQVLAVLTGVELADHAFGPKFRALQEQVEGLVEDERARFERRLLERHAVERPAGERRQADAVQHAGL